MEDFNTIFSEDEMEIESESDDDSEENDESDDFNETDIQFEESRIMEIAPDFDNDSAEQEFGFNGIESNVNENDEKINCISRVENKIKELFTDYFKSNPQFKRFMDNWCEYALTNYKDNSELSNFENEYNAIIGAFEKFGDNSDFSKNIDKFLRQVREVVVLTDEQIAEYKKSFTALRKDFKKWFEKERK